jgi:hypothetical protein
MACHETIEIPFIECIIEGEVDREVEPSISCRLRESEDLIETVS